MPNDPLWNDTSGSVDRSLDTLPIVVGNQVELVDGPGHDEVVSAVSARAAEAGYPLFCDVGTVHEVIPRGPVVVVVVSHPRAKGKFGVPFLWPGADFEGCSTGEPLNSLDDWVTEVFMELDEMFATASAGNLAGKFDRETGYNVIGLVHVIPGS